nr:hypothetical protein [Tomitella biformata]
MPVGAGGADDAPVAAREEMKCADSFIGLPGLSMSQMPPTSLWRSYSS